MKRTDDLLKPVPSVKLLMPFMLGILFRIHGSISSLDPFPCLMALLVLFMAYTALVYRFRSFHYKWVPGAFSGVFLMLAGFVITGQHHRHALLPDNPGRAYAKGIITEEPGIKENSIQLMLKATLHFDSVRYSINRLLSYVEKDSAAMELQMHDCIVFTGYIQPIQNNGNPHEFDYKTHMANQGVHYQIYIPSGKWKAPNTGYSRPFSLKLQAIRLRKALIDKMDKQGINGDELAVASALLLGYRDLLSPEVTQTFASTGAMHVLAVSGLHVGVIYLMVNLLLTFLDRNRHLKQMKLFIIMACIWGFALITGLSPSVCRAATMFSLLAFGKLIQRNANTYQIVLISAFILLIWNPYYLTEIGFQLSYAAVLSIIYFQPRIYRLLPVHYPVLDRVWGLISVSLAVQPGILPLSLYYFHQFPVYFLLTNLIVIPFAFLILSLGMLFFLFHSIPLLSNLLGQGLQWMLSGLHSAITWIQQLPFSSMRDLDLSIFELFLLLSLVFLIILFLEQRKTRLLPYIIACLLALLAFNLHENRIRENQKKLVVYNLTGNHALEIINGRHGFLLTDIPPKDFDRARRFCFRNNWIKLGIKAHDVLNPFQLSNEKKTSSPVERYTLSGFDEGYAFSHGGKRWLVISGEKLAEYQCHQMLQVDYLVLAGNTVFPVEKINRCFKTGMVIVDGGMKYYRRVNTIELLKKEGIPYYCIPDEGAFIWNKETNSLILKWLNRLQKK